MTCEPDRRRKTVSARKQFALQKQQLYQSQLTTSYLQTNQMIAVVWNWFEIYICVYFYYSVQPIQRLVSVR